MSKICRAASLLLFIAPLGAHARENPLLQRSGLPYQAPQFDRIQDQDYAPAFRQAIADHDREIATIAHDPTPPSFSNTIEALERSGQRLTRIQMTFAAVQQANADRALNEVQRDMAPILSRHTDSIFLNQPLFRRIKTVYDRREALKLSDEQRQLLKVTYQSFVHAGALLSEKKQEQLSTLNARLSELEASFQQKLVAAARSGALYVQNAHELSGLNNAARSAALAAAANRHLTRGWVIPLQNTTQQSALEELDDRTTREALFLRSWLRAERGDANDTRAVIREIALLRTKKAAMLGFPNFAAYTLYDQMARTPKNVAVFLARLTPPTRAAQRRDLTELARHFPQIKRRDLNAWDVQFCASKAEKADLALDPGEIRPYFELNRVLQDGVFYAAHELYGINFRRRTDIPVYQPDVMVYEVRDNDGRPLGLMYFDYFARDNKSGGAWMSNFVEQSTLLHTLPVIYNVANFEKGAPGSPTLLTLDDVRTMFHEFGHALHGLFAHQMYPSLSGTNVARDFVEFPSQFNENWALYPQVFFHYARHFKTNAPMPEALYNKICRASREFQGLKLGEILAAAQLDMSWHTISPKTPLQNVDMFETSALQRSGLDTGLVPPRYRSSYFLHIWANGYASSYYAYLWSEMLDRDVYAWFLAHGGLSRENGQRFRDKILSRGRTEDYGRMFRAFYGAEPALRPMLHQRGLE